MLFLLNGEGELQRLDNDRMFQGSNNATKLGVIYPYSGVTLAASFTLPNGMTTGYMTMPPLSTYTLKNGGGDVVKTFDNLYYASIPIPNTVTALQGVCKVTVAQTAVSGTGAAGSIDPAQVDVNTSYSASFTVEYASLPEYTVPDNPTDEDFQKLVTLLQAYQATVTGNVSELQGRVTTAESNIKDLQTRMTTAETDIDNAQADIEDLLADVGTLQGDVAEKQDKTDPNLKTDDKTVVGAINAIYDELTDTSGTGFASRLDTAEAEINVLDSRVEDVEEKTAMPLMTDFTVDVATSSATKFYNDGTSADVSLPTGDTVDRINYLTSASFTEAQWTEQSDGTYSLTLSAEQTGRTNNKYVLNLEVTDGTEQITSADKVVKNEDGSITLKDYTEPWSGRVITVAAGQHGSVIHFGTAVTGTGSQTSTDEELRAASLVGDAYINSNTGEVYKCTAVSTTTSTWEFQGSFKGAPGKDGADGEDGTDGAAATVTVGQVTTLPAGSQATVTNSGTENAAVLNFAIPQGATGQAGTDGQDGVGIDTIAAAGTDENGGNIYRINLTNGQNYTFTAPKGAQGAQGATGATGAPGKDFRIYKTYASIAAMNADAANVPDGEFVSIASNENDPDNGKVYQRSTDGETDFVFIFDLSGAQGIQGEAATIQIGQVLTGEPGTNASVENVGTANAAILNITIPRGNPGIDGTNGTDGAPGQDGADGAAATIQIGEVVTGAAGTNASVENTGTENAAILKFTIPRGATGTPGADGQDGAPGADGKNGATFTPSVDTNGNLSWSNDGNLPNPETVNLRGAQGEAATVQVGQVTTLPAGSQATVTNSGTNQAAVLNFGIPTGQPGADGQAATIAVGEVTTGAAGTQASVTNSGTENAAVLDFTIPKGADGANGVGVPAGGTTGQVLKKKSGADYDTEWATESGGGSGAKVVDIGQISLNFMETGDASVNITNEQYDALEGTGGTILKFSTSDGQDIYLNCFCLGNGIIYSAMIAEGGVVAAYTANIGGGSQKMVAIRASAVYGSTEGNIATVIDIGTVANFSPVEEGSWTVNISDEMYSKITAPSQETAQIKIADASGNVAYLTRYLDTDGSLIFASTYTDASQATLIQLFADVRGSAGSYKIEIVCTMSLLGPHPQFINIGVVQGFEVGVEGSWSVNIPDTIYNKIAESEDVSLVITGTNDVSVIMPQVQIIQGKKGFGTSFPLDQNGGRIEYAAGAGGAPGDYQLHIIAVVPDVGGGGGAGAQQNAIINRTASVTTADENSPDFVENNGDLWVKKITGYTPEVDTLSATLPSARSYTSAATAPNGKIYVFGGRTGVTSYTFLDDIVEFDPVAQTATTLDVTLPSRRSGASAATAPNGKIYVFGGRTATTTVINDIVEFDPVAQTVTKLGVTLPNARWATSAATALNGKIYVFGGQDADGILNSIVEFDPVAQTVITLDVTISVARYATSAATAPNGKIYVFGGQAAGTALNSVIEFDPVAQSVKYQNVLPYYTFGTSAATAPTGKIYVFDQGTIVEFDPMAQEATTLDTTLEHARLSSAATAPNGKIYVFGGNAGDDIAEFNVYAATTFAYRKIITADASGVIAASSFNATT